MAINYERVVMTPFDRKTCSIPKCQIDFIDSTVHEMFEAWGAYIEMPELVSHVKQNYIKWKKFDESLKF